MGSIPVGDSDIFICPTLVSFWSVQPSHFITQLTNAPSLFTYRNIDLDYILRQLWKKQMSVEPLQSSWLSAIVVFNLCMARWPQSTMLSKFLSMLERSVVRHWQFFRVATEPRWWYRYLYIIIITLFMEILSLDNEMSPKDFLFRTTWGHNGDNISETKQEQPWWVEKYALLNSFAIFVRQRKNL